MFEEQKDNPYQTVIVEYEVKISKLQDIPEYEKLIRNKDQKKYKEDELPPDLSCEILMKKIQA